MKKILTIGASNSKKSINKTFANYIASQINESEVINADLNELSLPLYSIDLENENGIPENAHKFISLIKESDGIVLSIAEHNGLPTAAFKNIWDWTSRIEQKFWVNKPIFLASTSPGRRGGKSALESIEKIMPHFDGNIISTYSLPKFFDNLKDNNITNNDINVVLNLKISTFSKSI